MSNYDDYIASAKKGGAKLKVLEIDQGILWLKAYGLQSEELEEIKNRPKIVSEAFLNQMMQLAYNEGAKAIERKSFEDGWFACWEDVMKKLGVREE